MACRTVVFRSVLLTEPWRPVNLRRSSVFASFRIFSSPATGIAGNFSISRARDSHPAKGILLRCCHNETPKSLSSSSSLDEQGPPQEAVLKAISGLASSHFSIFCFFNVFIFVGLLFGLTWG